MRIAWRIIVVLVLIAAVAGLGAYAYNVGLTNGLAQKVVPQGTQPQAVPVPYPYYWHPFFGFGGFGFLGCLIPLVLLFLFFGSMRALFWHGPMGWRHGHHGPWGWRDPEGKGVPPFFEEWHKRAHGESQDKPEEKSL